MLKPQSSRRHPTGVLYALPLEEVSRHRLVLRAGGSRSCAELKLQLLEVKQRGLQVIPAEPERAGQGYHALANL